MKTSVANTNHIITVLNSLTKNYPIIEIKGDNILSITQSLIQGGVQRI